MLSRTAALQKRLSLSRVPVVLLGPPASRRGVSTTTVVGLATRTASSSALTMPLSSDCSSTPRGPRQRPALQSDSMVRFLSTASNEATKDDDDNSEQPASESPEDDGNEAWEDAKQVETTNDSGKIEEEKSDTNKEAKPFKAETRQILDIMINSIYTDKEVWLREIVSNASDALEKLRHTQAANKEKLIDPEIPNEIKIEIDELDYSISITDTGIGMTREDMIHNLGTIAKSGSKKFMQDLQRVEAGEEIDPGKGIIGRFGVGFYSVFMVAEKVEVVSRSALEEHKHLKPQKWTSDGNGFEVEDVDDDIRVGRGTTVKLWVTMDWTRFTSEKKVEEILMRYSNFIGFPIYLMGRKLNTVQAIWARDPKEVEEEEYVSFYRFLANAVDSPLDTIHFRAEAPLDVKALFFIPSFHSEKFGMGRMEPSVSLYCRKVLIEAKSPDILPDWLRFLKGVVDSEDLPLSISREKAQGTNLVRKLRKALTRKFISHLAKMQKTDRDTYVDEFYKEYGFFLKEGVCHDEDFSASLAKLLYFESSKSSADKIITFDEYISNMRPEQNDIYYICAPTRDAAMDSPYMETFEKAGMEVLIAPTAIDDFVLGSLKTYEGRKIVSIESSEIDLSEIIKKRKEENPLDDLDEDDEIYKSDRPLSDLDAVEFCNWFRIELPEKVASCSVTNRLHASPAIITDHQSGSVRRMMKMVDTTSGSTRKEEVPLPKQHVEVNPGHPLIVGIHEMRSTSPTLARVLAEQVYDNCLVTAGLMDDSRAMIPRLNDLLITIVENNQAKDEKKKASSSSKKVIEPGEKQTVEAEVIPPAQSK